MTKARIGKSRRNGYLDSQVVYLEASQCLSTLERLKPSTFAISKRQHPLASLENKKTRLAEFLTAEGSDKASIHDYDMVYEWLIGDPSKIELLVEIGIGTDNPDAPSSMGLMGQPGASCRAFLNWGVKRVIAADIDKGCLSKSQPYESFWVDQQRISTFESLVRRIQELDGADFIIIDGLHTFEADINSVIALLPQLKKGGVLAVEDVEANDKISKLWVTAIACLPDSYRAQVLTRRAAQMILIERI